MMGQFIFPTLGKLGLDVQVIFRNTSRIMRNSPSASKENDISVSLSQYCDGELITQEQKTYIVPFEKFLQLDAKNCSLLDTSDSDHLIVAKCTLPEKGDAYFPQEHQLTYTDKKSGSWANLLYDQLPIFSSTQPTPPIVLIASKIWVSELLNTYVVFANASESIAKPQEPLVLHIMAQDGSVIFKEVRNEKYNSCWIFDVKSAVQDKLALGKTPLSLTVVARGGSSNYVITTFVRNEEFGSIALEHSLSPHYYFTGDRRRVRKEALMFDL